MFGLQPEQLGFVLGAAVGGVFGIILLASLFSFAFIGRLGNRDQRLWVVVLTGIVGTGLSAFNEGKDGFANRIVNIPKMESAIAYALATLIVAALVVWWEEKPISTDGRQFGVGRIFALVLAVPLTLVGLGNVAASIFTAATEGMAAPGLGVSKAEMRQIMLKGDMAPFWQVVSEMAPEEMDLVIDRLFARESEIKNVDQGRQIFNRAVIDYRVSLATYGPAMTDGQRKEILVANADLLRQFEERPELCAQVAMTGGQSLSQDELRSAKDAFNNVLIVMTENLLSAKQAESNGANLPVPPTESDYAALLSKLVDMGASEGQMQALFDEDATHPEYCEATIAFLDAAARQEGASGEAVRFEVTQSMLVAAP